MSLFSNHSGQGQEKNHPEISTQPQAATHRRIDQGARLYDRKRILWRVLPGFGGAIDGPEPETTQSIVRQLEHALRKERQRGRAGAWSYDLNRHLALAQAHRAEREHLDRLAPPLAKPD